MPRQEASRGTFTAQEAGSAGDSARNRRARAAGFALLLAVLSVLSAGLVVTHFGTRVYRWRALDVAVSIQPAPRGETRLAFTPLGELRARTHETPLALRVALRAISFDGVRDLVERPPDRAVLEEEFKSAARAALLDFARQQVALGAVGGLLVPLALHLRRARWWLHCAACGALFTAAAFYLTTRTFNPSAFASPTYTGSLRQADWVIEMVKDGFLRAEALSDRLRTAARNLQALYLRLNEAQGVEHPDDLIRVLHVSDIHNNPAAVAFVRELADKSRVDLVVDTGDLSDLGLPLENRLSQGLAGLGVPYLFCPGNHDSRATVAGVLRMPTGAALEGEPVTVAGLRLLGAADPASLRPGAGDVNTSDQALRNAGEQLLAAYDQSDPKPDLVCVHNPRQAEPLVGKARVILCGHMHRAQIEEREGTILCNAGTTGGAGVRFLDRTGGVPFTAAILAFRPASPPRLVHIDQVSLAGTLGEYSISRRSFPEEAPPLTADAGGPPGP